MIMRIFYFIVALSVLICPVLTGQVWTGNASNLASVSSNWIGGIPSNNSNLIFQSSGRDEIFFNWPSAVTSVGDIIFNSNSKDYTFNGNSYSQYLRVGNIFNNESDSTQIFNINIELKNNRTVRSEGEIFFNGDIFLQTGNGNLSFDGSGKINFGENTRLENITNLTLMNGVDLNLGGSSLNFESLNVTGPSIIDFATTSEVSIESLTFSGNGSLTILNWSTNDYFFVQAQVSPQDLGRVIFADFDIGATWNGGNINPVPEPSTLTILSALLAPFFFKRKRRFI